MSGDPRSIPLSDDELFPAAAFFEIGLEKFGREALAPLNIEFLSPRRTERKDLRRSSARNCLMYRIPKTEELRIVGPRLPRP
jgi:serine/threonine protein kinase HipA of HipAB toxin-antitoxin module